MAPLEVRALTPRELAGAAALVVAAAERVAQSAAMPVALAEPAQAHKVLVAAGEGALGAFDDDGALCGVAALRLAGDTGCIDVLAAARDGGGAGGALLDALSARADAAGLGALRLRLPAGEVRAFALAQGRGFAVTDVAARLIRAPLPPPRLDASRALQVAAAEPGDREGLLELVRRLLHLEPDAVVAPRASLVAKRRGQVVGYLTVDGGMLGPGLALDARDLGTLLGRALHDTQGPVMTVLSTAVPSVMAALSLGFRVIGSELVMHRGLAPPTRPPVAYD